MSSGYTVGSAIGRIQTYPSASDLPSVAPDGTVALTLDADVLYAFNAGTSMWVVLADPGGGGLVSINGDTSSAQVIAGTAPVSVSSSSGTTTLSMHVADATHNGYLSSANWVSFNAKQAALTIGNFTDAGTDGITVTGGTGSVIGSGTSIAQHVSDATHNGYLASADFVTFSAKQPAGNYITALTGDVTATGPNSVAAVLSQAVHKRYVDFVSGNDANTGSLVSPWKTLQHAYNSISPTINEPYTIYLSGGNNDTDSAITAKPNVNLVSDYNIQITPAFTISGGTTNDGCAFSNITFDGAFSWVRNDNSAIGVTFNECQFFSGPTVKQTGAGTASVTAYNSVFVNAAFQTSAFAFFFGCDFLGATTTFDDVSGGLSYYQFSACYNSSALSISGAVNPAYFAGCIQDVAFGASLTFVTTGSGTPAVQFDSAGLPPTYTGSPTLFYSSLAQYESYTPTTAGNWVSGVPTTVLGALDKLAAAVKPGSGASGSFTTVDLKTVTVVNGIITSIV